MLFKNLDEIRPFIAVGSGTEFARLKPHIQNAESNFIYPILGNDLTTKIQQSFDQTEPPVEPYSEKLPELLWLTQKAIIHLTYWIGFQVLNASISDGGFKRTESEKQKSLFKYQEDELKEYFKTTGFNALDDILIFIENNISEFPDFVNSESWTIRKTNFIPDTKSFDQIVFINNCRLTFLRLNSYMKLIEDFYMIPILGQPLFDELKAEIIKKEPSEKSLKILPYIQKPMAFFASAFLMEETGADLLDKGLYFESKTAGFLSNENKQPAQQEMIISLTKRNRLFAENYLERLKSFIRSNPEDFPEFSTLTGSVFRRDNTNKKTFWA